MIPADSPRHGTNSGYTAGCRESCCREARRAYNQQYRQSEAYLSGGKLRSQQLAQERHRSRQGTKPPSHGNLNAYNHYGCRCTPCSDARKAVYQPTGLLPKVRRRG